MHCSYEKNCISIIQQLSYITFTERENIYISVYKFNTMRVLTEIYSKFHYVLF